MGRIGFSSLLLPLQSRGSPWLSSFQSEGGYDSFTCTQSGFSITRHDRFCLSKNGSIKLVYHRQIKGKIKMLTIHRSSTGRRYACFSVGCDPFRLPHISTQVGIDVGLKTFARVRERIRFRRGNFIPQESGKIVNSYGVICVEDLHVNRRTHNHCIAKSIHEASWSDFFDRLFSKAEDASQMALKVNPAYTPQDCSRCHR